MKYALKEISTISAGQGAPQGDNSYCDNGIPFVKAGNLLELIEGKPIDCIQKVADDVAKKHRLKLYPKGTVLFAKSGMSCLKGYVYILPCDAYVVSHLACITPYENISQYLKYYFDYNKPNKLIKDSAYPSISLTDIGELRIDIKDCECRQNIVSILSKIEKMIFARKQQLQQFDELVKARFIEMFGSPVSNPMSWKTKTFKETALRLSDGPFGSNLKSEHYSEAGVRVIRLGNIGIGEFIDKDKSYISYGHYEKIKKYTCKPGEVVIGTLGDPNLRACLIPYEIEFAVNKADCVHYVPNEELLPIFACQYINCPETMLLASSMVHGQTRTRVSSGQIAQMPIFIPPIESQKRFAEFVEQIDKSKITVQQSLEKLGTLKNALMQKYFG